MSGSAQILVVEDEALVAAHLEENLKTLGYRVPAIAATGVDALRLAEAHQPDLILMDITLRGTMTGIDVAERVLHASRIPVVYLTSHADDATLRKAKSTEPYGYILKPFNPRELKITVEMALYKHQMDVKLRATEQWFGTTLRSVGDAVIATDEKQRITFMNPVAEKLTGWRKEDAKGKAIGSVLRLEGETTAEKVSNPIEATLLTGEVVGLADKTLLLSRDGRRIPIDDSAAPIRDDSGSVGGAVMVFRDISERRRTQELFQRLIEHGSDVITVLDRDGSVRFQSRSAHNLWKCSEQEHIGQPFLLLVHEEDREKVAAALRNASQTDDVVLVDYRIMTKGNECRKVESVVKDLLGHEPISGVVLNTRDVTERKELEAKLAQADRLATVGILAAGVGHEINNPLAFMLLNLNALTEDLPRIAEAVRRYETILTNRLGAHETRSILASVWSGMQPNAVDQVSDKAREITSGASRIAKIVRDLRIFSRQDVESQEEVEINLVMDSALGLAASEIKQRAFLVTEYGELPRVLANSGRLAQVFLNLLMNAVQALPARSSSEKKIGVRTWREGDEVCAQVTDSGMGISKEHLARLFDPFFTTKPAGMGTGLGLSISHSIIASYGGRIEVESTWGEGSQFTVRLPIARNTPPAAPMAESPALMDGAHLPLRADAVRVLVIDDEPLIGKTIGRALFGQQTFSVGSVAEAMILLEDTEPFDVIFCDLTMPYEGGKELYERVRCGHPSLLRRIVFITGGVFGEEAREFIDQVPNLTIEKPFLTEDLYRAINAVTGRRTEPPSSGNPR